MADYPFTPTTGSLSIPAYDPVKTCTVDWEGNTFAPSTETRGKAKGATSAALVAMTYTKALTTDMIGLTTMAGIGYLPAGVTVVGARPGGRRPPGT